VSARHRTAAASAFRTRGKSSRVNKKQVIGYFTADLSRTLRQIALEEGTSLQALIGEAVDLSRKRAVYTRAWRALEDMLLALPMDLPISRPD
jgi:hypothetical protein